MANCNDESFCQNKWLLETKEASLHDPVLLLFSSDIRCRRLVDCSDEHRRRDFNRRWLIFVPVLVQKILLSCRKPMNQIGNALEMWLNLLSNNGCLFKLLLNNLKGKVARPDRSSAAFRSVAAHADWRVEQVRSGRPGQIKYNTSLSLMAAKLSHENKAFIEAVVIDHWNLSISTNTT